MSTSSERQIESINFTYSVHDFEKDWRGVRRYEKEGMAAKKVEVHLSVGSSGRRRIPSEQNKEPSTVSGWFIDRYGDDPDHLYARYMRFTMLAAVFEDYEMEIREAGLPLHDGYSPKLLPRLLKLKVRADGHSIARFDPKDVLRAIRDPGKASGINTGTRSSA